LILSQAFKDSPNKKIKKQTKQTGYKKMKRDKKKQDDRLLKQLSRMERKQQESLRRMILSDPVFKLA